MRRLITIGAILLVLAACTSDGGTAPPKQAATTTTTPTTAATVPDVKTLEIRAMAMVKRAGFPKVTVSPTGINGQTDPNLVGALAHGEILNQQQDNYDQYIDLSLFASNEERDAALANDTGAITQSGGAFQGPSVVLVGEHFYAVTASVQEGGGWPLAPEQIAKRLGARLK